MNPLTLNEDLLSDPGVEFNDVPPRVSRLACAVAEAENGSPAQLRTARRLLAEHLAEHFPGQVIEDDRGVCHWVDATGSLHSFVASDR